MGGRPRRPHHPHRLPALSGGAARPGARSRSPEAETRRRYDAIAASYDRRWTRYVERSARETLSRADPPAAGRILDVGCGTGVLLAEISRSRPGALLAGADLSLAMLAVARDRLGSGALLVQADAAALPFRAGAFDLVVSASALHHWPDADGALAEMRRALAPGARVAVTDWCADRWLDRARDRLHRRFQPAHHRALRSAELASLLRDAGFADVRVERWRIGLRWGMMTGLGSTPSLGP